MVGDFGFDPLGLGEEKETLAWYRQAELQNGRWAMLGTAGILVPDLMAHAGISLPPTDASTFSWLEIAKAKVAFPQADTMTLALVTAALFAFPEHKRIYAYKSPGSQGEEGTLFRSSFKDCASDGYPGGPFDFLGFTKGKSAEAVNELKLKEIKNARLAMVAFLGINMQAISTGSDSPIDNLIAHLSDPWHVTVATNAYAIPHILGN